MPPITFGDVSPVVNVGEVPNTATPVPVSSVNADARLADEGVARKVATPVPSPETPVDIGRPITFVITPDAGVPNAGVVKVGEVNVLLLIVCAFVLKVNSSTTLAKSGIVKVVAPTV